MWRMNAALLLCTLLLCSQVMCQDDAVTDVPAADPAADDAAAASDATDAPAAAPASDAPQPGDAATDAPAAAAIPDGSAAPAAPAGDGQSPVTLPSDAGGEGGDTAGTTGTTPDPAVGGGEVAAATEEPKIVKTVVPDTVCVGKDEITEGGAVKVAVTTADCEATKRIIQENPAGWCHKENCNLKLFQEGNDLLVASEDAHLVTLAEALQSGGLKEQLGVSKVDVPSSSGSSVFMGILVTGLLAAVAMTVGYFKCQRRTEAKGVRLAEEAYPVDQENQGNTLVSVAPLNPPPETPEKPSANGESTEPPKSQAPPTNGHSTAAKTADTEL